MTNIKLREVKTMTTDTRYELMGWKDKKSIRLEKSDTKTEADSIVNEWKKEGIVDAIDVWVASSDGNHIYSKTAFILAEDGKWHKKEYRYCEEKKGEENV